MDDIAVKVDHVSKDFHYTSHRTNSIKSLFTSLSFRREGKTKDIQRALKDISFEIKKGEFFGIVGRNGSGKSTLLKMIAGIYQPNKGSVQVNGKLVPFIELGVGFNPELTGKENVYLNGALLGFSKKEISAMYNEIVEFAELEKFMDQRLKNYSSGMQVRLAFSMAVRAKAEILLIDEVLAVGDADFQRKCFDYFKKLKKQKKTVIFVGHDMQVIREYCDRAILVENGYIKDSGSVKSVTEGYIRQFMHNESTLNTSSNRWGNQYVVYKNPRATVNAKNIELRATLTVKKSVEDLILGFTVISEDGFEIMGTNSRIKQHKLSSVTSGSTYNIVWGFDNILEDGSYKLSLTAHGFSGEPVYDWWSDALSISVNKMERTGYRVCPDINLQIVRQ